METNVRRIELELYPNYLTFNLYHLAFYKIMKFQIK